MKPLKSKNLDKHLLNTISYFSFFGYPPSFDEIHTFFPIKIAKNKLRTLLTSFVRQKKLISYQLTPLYPSPQSNSLSSRPKWRDLFARNDHLGYYNNLKHAYFQISNLKFKINLYTLPQYTNKFEIRDSKFKNLFDLTLQRRRITQKKLASMYRYIEVLRKIPFIRFVGITGSASMGNCKPDDDVDIFIITMENCLFIGRFFAILLAHIMHVRNDKNSVCLNLFFDESDLVIPLQKQTPYVAHEVLQMKPVVDKDQTYERFLEKNRWVSKIFPNVVNDLALSSRANPPTRRGSRGIPFLSFLFSPFEFLLKTFQLAIIRRNKTGLIVSPTQLWLFKKDFEKKMENKMNEQAHL